eukprot:Hpha_TRINITY_DN16637_c1_g6::TRINITY_DN16637_c1_g6_i1::g.179142::m.179142
MGILSAAVIVALFLQPGGAQQGATGKRVVSAGPLDGVGPRVEQLRGQLNGYLFEAWEWLRDRVETVRSVGDASRAHADARAAASAAAARVELRIGEADHSCWTLVRAARLRLLGGASVHHTIHETLVPIGAASAATTAANSCVMFHGHKSNFSLHCVGGPGKSSDVETAALFAGPKEARTGYLKPDGDWVPEKELDADEVATAALEHADGVNGIRVAPVFWAHGPAGTLEVQSRCSAPSVGGVPAVFAWVSLPATALVQRSEAARLLLTHQGDSLVASAGNPCGHNSACPAQCNDAHLSGWEMAACGAVGTATQMPLVVVGEKPNESWSVAVESAGPSGLNVAAVVAYTSLYTVLQPRGAGEWIIVFVFILLASFCLVRACRRTNDTKAVGKHAPVGTQEDAAPSAAPQVFSPEVAPVAPYRQYREVDEDEMHTPRSLRSRANGGAVEDQYEDDDRPLPGLGVHGGVLPRRASASHSPAGVWSPISPQRSTTPVRSYSPSDVRYGKSPRPPRSNRPPPSPRPSARGDDDPNEVINRALEQLQQAAERVAEMVPLGHPSPGRASHLSARRSVASSAARRRSGSASVRSSSAPPMRYSHLAGGVVRPLPSPKRGPNLGPPASNRPPRHLSRSASPLPPQRRPAPVRLSAQNLSMQPGPPVIRGYRVPPQPPSESGSSYISFPSGSVQRRKRPASRPRAAPPAPKSSPVQMPPPRAYLG